MKVGSTGFLLSSAALRLIKGDCNLDPGGSGNPLFLLGQVAAPERPGGAPLSPAKVQKINIWEVFKMATKETAKAKFVSSVTSDLAPRKMADKLSTYLGVPVSEGAAPIQNWIKVVARNAGDLFDKAYENMKAAYR
jgi:hypothetical protein